MKLFTLNKAQILVQERNTPQAKRHRWAYATCFLQNQQFHYIYADEFGFNLGNKEDLKKIMPITSPITFSSDILRFL